MALQHVDYSSTSYPPSVILVRGGGQQGGKPGKKASKKKATKKKGK